MIKYSVLSPQGDLLRLGTCQESLLAAQAAVGEVVVEGWVEAPASPTVLNYTAKRSSEYPPIGAQLDMLWHSMNNGEIPKAGAFFEAVKAIKEQYPKE